MRILFYLPAVTPWWFSNIVVRVIRAVAHEHETHVMVPPFWRGTGIGKGEAQHIQSLPHVHWHLLGGADHPLLRTDPGGSVGGEALLELVAELAPDLTLCRSADVITPARFPGAIRYLMEGGAPPLHLKPECITLKNAPFDHGFMPPLQPATAARLDAIAGQLWPDMLARLKTPTRAAFLKATGLERDDGRRIIGLPLEYEQPENFFGMHHAFPNNAAMITAIAEEIGDTEQLFVTHHPLTELHGDTSAADAAVSAQGGRVKVLSRSGPADERDQLGNDPTSAMIPHCDAVVLGNSKSWSIAAALGTPMTRLSCAPSAKWIGAYDAIGPLLSDLERGRAVAADPVLTRRWFAHHLLENVIDPTDPDFCARDITDCVFDPARPACWDGTLARYRATLPPLETAPIMEQSYA